MSPADYYTAFDVTTAGYKSWFFPAFGLILAAIPLLRIRETLTEKRRALRKGRRSRSGHTEGDLAPWLMLGGIGLWTSISFITTFSDYQAAVTAMQNHQAAIVEGVVTDFHPMPAGGHANESFIVNGVKFEYSDFLITAGFNNTASHGGPVREGLEVRIWHQRGEILRLDIKKKPSKAPEPTRAS